MWRDCGDLGGSRGSEVMDLISFPGRLKNFYFQFIVFSCRAVIILDVS